MKNLYIYYINRYKNMFFLPKIIIALLIVVILIYSCQSCFKHREGATFTNLDNNKSQTPLSDSNRSIILMELVTNIQKHDVALNIVHPEYQVNNVNINPKDNKFSNIKILLNIMKNQDKEIDKLLPNYVPSSDLQGLIDGTLMGNLGKQLAISTITPIKPLTDVDPKAMMELSNKYYTASDQHGDTMTATLLSSQGDVYKSNAIKAQYTNSLVNDKVYNPPELSDTAAQSILESNYLSNMIIIVQYQDIAINNIIDNISYNVMSIYKKKE